ncbi:SRPBCC family protein [Brevibacterium atlanticum]|uniref:SRPBCC family protein n=1 Tax=Brevibacterium atlanticum TaxID=2697563 RepID=UPI00141DB337|nr:SRPBCC family protein [Brevibacterium atlanticum]
MSHDHVTPRAGESSPFHFDDRWSVDADIDTVWAVLERVDEWPQWWPGLAAVEPVGDKVRPGSRAQVVVRTPIGVPLRFTLEVEALTAPNLVVLRAHGDLRGEGVWTVSEHDGTTHVDSLWCVTSTRTMIRILRPVASLMHAIVMRAGERGLAARLTDPRAHP